MTKVFEYTENYNGILRISLVVGVIAAVAAVFGLFVSGPGLFFQAYLYAFLFWLGISLGLLTLLLLHFAVGSRWGIAIRRIAEAGAGSIWAMAILFIPLLFGLPYLFPWARPAEVAASTELQAKAFYLNVPFFIVRAVIYFLVWILIGLVINRLAVRMVTSGVDEQTIHNRLQGFSSLGLILYGLTATFAAVDWIMSLQPLWSSTAFGLLIIIAQVLTAMSFAIMMLNLFPSLGMGVPWKYFRTPIPYRDLGALLMTLILGWAYLAYFQLLIMWAGNLPREVIWYLTRSNNGWQWVGIFVALFQFVLPFLLLLTLRIRHNLRILAWVGGLLLLTNLVNIFWYVKPAFFPNLVTVSWLDFVTPFAVGGFWFAAFIYALKRMPVLTPEDRSILHLTTELEKPTP